VVFVSTTYSYLYEIFFSANEITNCFGAMTIGAAYPGYSSFDFFGASNVFIINGNSYEILFPTGIFFS
jgi:hypothetical protein